MTPEERKAALAQAIANLREALKRAEGDFTTAQVTMGGGQTLVNASTRSGQITRPINDWDLPEQNQFPPEASN